MREVPGKSLGNSSDKVQGITGGLGEVVVVLWPGSSPTEPQTPKNSKTRRSDSKVTLGVLVKVTQKLLKSDSRVTLSTVFVTLSHF